MIVIILIINYNNSKILLLLLLLLLLPKTLYTSYKVFATTTTNKHKGNISRLPKWSKSLIMAMIHNPNHKQRHNQSMRLSTVTNRERMYNDINNNNSTNINNNENVYSVSTAMSMMRFTIAKCT